jgi:hypothetical protein
MQIKTGSRIALALVCLSVALAGCGEARKPSLEEVTAKVQLAPYITTTVSELTLTTLSTANGKQLPEGSWQVCAKVVSSPAENLYVRQPDTPRMHQARQRVLDAANAYTGIAASIQLPPSVIQVAQPSDRDEHRIRMAAVQKGKGWDLQALDAESNTKPAWIEGRPLSSFPGAAVEGSPEADAAYERFEKASAALAALAESKKTMTDMILRELAPPGMNTGDSHLRRLAHSRAQDRIDAQARQIIDQLKKN